MRQIRLQRLSPQFNRNSLLDGEHQLLPKGKAQSKTKLNPMFILKTYNKLPTLDKLPFLQMTPPRPALRKFWSVEKP